MSSKDDRHLPPPLLDVDQLGRLLRRPPSWIYRQVEAGRLPVIRVGRLLRFDPREIDAWITARREGPTFADPQRARDADGRFVLDKGDLEVVLGSVLRRQHLRSPRRWHLDDEVTFEGDIASRPRRSSSGAGHLIFWLDGVQVRVEVSPWVLDRLPRKGARVRVSGKFFDKDRLGPEVLATTVELCPPI